MAAERLGHVVRPTVRVVRDDNSSFDAIHHAPVVRTTTDALTFEFTYAETSSELTVRVVVDLNVMDGVSATRILMTALHYLEGRVVDDECDRVSRTRSNRLECSVVRMLYNGARSLVRSLTYVLSRPKVLFIGGSGAYATYGPTGLTFKEVVASMSGTQHCLGYICTQNYAPKVAVACVDHENLLRRDRMHLDTVIPKSPPAVARPWSLAYMLSKPWVFWNNYGRHECPDTLTPTAFLWDWTNSRFPRGVVCICIRDRPFWVCLGSDSVPPALRGTQPNHSGTFHGYDAR